MPSSLVFAALVLAWLVVLVPVIARRRQMVPRPAEADLCARVLPRSGGAPANREEHADRELTVTHTPSGTHGGATATVPSTPEPRAERSRGGAAVIERGGRADHERVAALNSELDSELDLDSYDAGYDDADDWDDDRYDDDDLHDLHDRHADDGDDRYAGDLDHRGGEPDDDHDDADRGSCALRPYRPGRGGFDPDAAAAAAQSRHNFRQRVALGLIAVAVLSALAALVVSSVLWWLHLGTGLVLIGYLVFLRRQTRIEEDLRARRAARLSGERRALESRRERQAQHEARMAAVHRDADQWDEDDWAHEDGARDEDDGRDEDGYDGYDDVDEVPEPRRWAAPRTPAPPVPEGMELVADSPDDPAFHRLDGRESIPAYRRAAGV